MLKFLRKFNKVRNGMIKDVSRIDIGTDSPSMFQYYKNEFVCTTNGTRQCYNVPDYKDHCVDLASQRINTVLKNKNNIIVHSHEYIHDCSAFSSFTENIITSCEKEREVEICIGKKKDKITNKRVNMMTIKLDNDCINMFKYSKYFYEYGILSNCKDNRCYITPSYYLERVSRDKNEMSDVFFNGDIPLIMFTFWNLKNKRGENIKKLDYFDIMSYDE